MFELSEFIFTRHATSPSRISSSSKAFPKSSAGSVWCPDETKPDVDSVARDTWEATELETRMLDFHSTEET